MLNLLRIKQNQLLAYNAQSQGALERFHQTLECILRQTVLCQIDWEVGLILAAREAAQVNTGFNPN